MAFDYPWLIGGLSEVSLSLSRTLAYVASGGMEGVATPGDLRVTPNSAMQLNIAPGAFTTVSRFQGAGGQSYIGFNDATATLTIPANTGANPAYYLVYAKVTDPAYDAIDQTPHQVELTYVSASSNTANSLSDVGLSDTTGYVIARLEIPANTAAITTAMIVDLRSVVHQRRFEDEYMLSGGFSTVDLTSSSYVAFPSAANWNIKIPTWATRLKVIGHIGGYKIVEGGNGGNVVGQFRVAYGTLTGPPTQYNHSMPAGFGTIDAGASTVIASWYIPDALRGTTQSMTFQAKRDSGTTGTNIRADGGTNIAMQVIFIEEADKGV